MSGYLHKNYAQSLAEFGTPLKLSHSDGWLIKREIPGFPYFDVMGCYPIFSCQNWEGLNKDIEDLNKELVSVSIVTDPFGNFTLPYLQQCFPDVTIPFKRHYVIDLQKEMEEHISSHHQRNVKKSIKNIQVKKYENPINALDDWVQLYTVLIERHKIKGIAKFSSAAFLKQLKIPGIIAFRAFVENKTIGILLWFTQGDIAYYHLGAYSDLGYKLRASFSLFWRSIQYFSETNLKWLSLGAGAGLSNDKPDGLNRFKQGWATDTKLTYFCGKILNHDKYSTILNKLNISDSNYFPAYRSGEFG